MDIDHLTEQERSNMLAEMADLYYNQGKTQSEIAKYYETNRFRVAKLLQDARNEQIVEIRINHSNERNSGLEMELLKNLPLDRAIVVNTQYSTYIDGIKMLGKAGADYLMNILKPGITIGISWGKTIYSGISQIPSVVGSPVSAVQLAGSMGMSNPSVESRELVRMVASAFNGTGHYLDAPIYIKDPVIRERLYQEPVVRETFDKASSLDVVLSGIGSRSSLPNANAAFREYLTEKDISAQEQCIGSLYGYVLDKNGNVADIELNQKRFGIPMEKIQKAPHRIIFASGRHKTECIQKAVRNHLFNELVTDSDTAFHLLEQL